MLSDTHGGDQTFVHEASHDVGALVWLYEDAADPKLKDPALRARDLEGLTASELLEQGVAVTNWHAELDELSHAEAPLLVHRVEEDGILFRFTAPDRPVTGHELCYWCAGFGHFVDPKVGQPATIGTRLKGDHPKDDMVALVEGNVNAMVTHDDPADLPEDALRQDGLDDAPYGERILLVLLAEDDGVVDGWTLPAIGRGSVSPSTAAAWPLRFHEPPRATNCGGGIEPAT